MHSKPSIIIALILGLNISVIAQSSNTFKVPPGEKVYDAIAKTELYEYPEFKEGRVVVRNGTFSPAKMNYNRLFGEMQFLVRRMDTSSERKNDTLSLADEKNIKFISISSDTFYFDNGYLQQIARFGKMKLAKKTLLQFSNKEKTGALGLKGAGDIETYTSLTIRQEIKELVAAETLYFSKRISYWIGDEFNHFTELTKKNLLKSYNEKSREISDWLNENKINFTNEDDLKKLSAFLQKM